MLDRIKDFLVGCFENVVFYVKFLLSYLVARAKEMSTYHGVAAVGAGLVLLGVLGGSTLSFVLGVAAVGIGSYQILKTDS